MKLSHLLQSFLRSRIPSHSPPPSFASTISLLLPSSLPSSDGRSMRRLAPLPLRRRGPGSPTPPQSITSGSGLSLPPSASPPGETLSGQRLGLQLYASVHLLLFLLHFSVVPSKFLFFTSSSFHCTIYFVSCSRSRSCSSSFILLFIVFFSSANVIRFICYIWHHRL